LTAAEGTIGKLLKDPALFDDFRKTIADVRLLIGDINNGKEPSVSCSRATSCTIS